MNGKDIVTALYRGKTFNKYLFNYEITIKFTYIYNKFDFELCKFTEYMIMYLLLLNSLHWFGFNFITSTILIFNLFIFKSYGCCQLLLFISYSDN